MKKTALLAAAAALAAASPAMAQGYLGARYASSNTDIIGGSADLTTWQGEGEFGWNGGGWGGQIGATFGNTEFDGGPDASMWTGNAHLYWQGGAWRLGGVVATTQVDDFDIDETSYGIEGMWDMGPNSNIYGDILFGNSSLFGLTDLDTWNLDVGGNLYSSPNVRFGGYIGTGNVDTGGADFNTTSFGLNTEFQPWSAPVSITLAYNYYDIDDIDTTTSAFSIGARWNFGGGTLHDRNNVTPFSTDSGNMSRILATN